MSADPRSPATVENRTNTGVRLPASAKGAARVNSVRGFVGFEIAVGAGAASMHDAFGNTLMIEVGDFLAKNEILEQRRAAKAGFQRVLVVPTGTPWLVVST